jgi:hypothetical protein
MPGSPGKIFAKISLITSYGGRVQGCVLQRFSCRRFPHAGVFGVFQPSPSDLAGGRASTRAFSLKILKDEEYFLLHFSPAQAILFFIALHYTSWKRC